MHDRYDYEPREHPDWSEFSDTQPGEPVIDYSIWPPEPPEPEAARDNSRRRMARLAWRVALLSAMGAAAFVILFVRSAPGQTTQSVVRPPASAAATPAPSPQHPRASAALRPGHRAAAPKPAAQASPTLAPPPANPAPEPEDSGGHSGRGGPGR